MAQYSKQKVDYLNDGRSIFEVVMIADQFGTLVGPSNPSAMPKLDCVSVLDILVLAMVCT